VPVSAAMAGTALAIIKPAARDANIFFIMKTSYITLFVDAFIMPYICDENVTILEKKYFLPQGIFSAKL
jgi:hypothetical protein